MSGYDGYYTPGDHWGIATRWVDGLAFDTVGHLRGENYSYNMLIAKMLQILLLTYNLGAYSNSVICQLWKISWQCLQHITLS